MGKSKMSSSRNSFSFCFFDIIHYFFDFGKTYYEWFGQHGVIFVPALKDRACQMRSIIVL